MFFLDKAADGTLMLINYKILLSTNVPYAALSRKNILPEDGRTVAAKTCRPVYKCNSSVVGFTNKSA
jgi:hypothetical protein